MTKKYNGHCACGAVTGDVQLIASPRFMAPEVLIDNRTVANKIVLPRK